MVGRERERETCDNRDTVLDKIENRGEDAIERRNGIVEWIA